MSQSLQPKIRVAVPGDEPAMHEAHMRSIREICVKDHGEEEIRGWGFRPLGDRWIEAIKVGFVWVVELQGKICGVAYLKVLKKEDENDESDENYRPTAYIHALYLTPEVVGQGFGRRLAGLMIEQARKSKVKSISLESSITAHDFYKKLGFQDSGDMNRAEIGGYPVTCFPMSLDL